MTDLHHCDIWQFEEILHTENAHAILGCDEDRQGILVCYTPGYGTQVNYCPFCGYRAKVQTGWKGEEND